MVVLSIDNTEIFEAYKIWFIIMDDYIVKYNINYKRFPFRILSKSKIISFIVELVKKDTMDWEMAVTTF